MASHFVPYFCPMAQPQTAWITGGSRGIGFACANALANEGYRIALSARNPDELHAAKSKLDATGATIKLFPCNVGVEADVKNAYQGILREFDAPDVLINCAGIGPWDTFSETSTKAFDAVIATNVRGTFLTAREVLPAMYAKKNGAIVQLISIAGLKAFKNGSAYVASKFAVRGFTESLREEARKHGVRVIAVFPGATETELWHAEDRQKYHERMMQPEDIAAAIVHALKQPVRTLIEEIVIRPIQ
jgi:3-oxoacyl-[acyl-carrier protein] reductase